MPARIDESFRNAELWRQEALELREMLLGCGLTEELKWGSPCYTHDGRNICIIQRMKGFLALMFFKGALIEDPDGVLEIQGPNSRAGYRIRFAGVPDVVRLKKSVKACVRAAIEVEKAGLEVSPAEDPDYPEELIDRFEADPDFQVAFDRLTPGRRRGYVLRFSDAKQSSTRAGRIEKYRRRILEGKGLHDR